LIDVLKAKAWIAETKRLLGVETAYALNKVIHGEDGVDLRYFERIQRGTHSPGAGLLRDVEKKIAGSRDVYLIGPLHQGQYIQLWKALSGSVDEVWEVLEQFEPAYARSHLFGFTQQHRVDYLLSQMTTDGTAIELEKGPVMSDLMDRGMGVLELPDGELRPEDQELFDTHVWVYRPPVDQKSDMIDLKLEHPVTRLMAEGRLMFDLRILAATVAIWRLAHFTGECWREMDHLMRGLMLSPGLRFMRDPQGKIIGTIPDMHQLSALGRVLQPLTIEQDFINLIDQIWQQSARKYAAVIHAIVHRRSAA
jgi:hypothetical protein